MSIRLLAPLTIPLDELPADGITPGRGANESAFSVPQR